MTHRRPADAGGVEVCFRALIPARVRPLSRQKWRHFIPPLTLVFCNPEGDYYKPDQISSKVAEITAKAGLRGIGLHSLRHGHASQLLSEGVPIPTVSKRLGHANPSITLKLYSHALESDELAAAQRWDNAFAEVVQAYANAPRHK